MKKIGIIFACIIAIGAGAYYFISTAETKSTTITLEGYDSEAAAKETPVESFQNTNTPQNTTASGMNPAHGQPGHRCDIAVGAPLTAPVDGSLLNINGTTLNPAHGQPGHRCDIAVGAPLPTS
ncbi:hypothetical protein JM658_06640 [Joostella atrarenae]|uniref:Uncharacterized protein n=1 Tax=Joostella atrarenae TaxID=679257 RepID=A0ABS9J247_9FLAO|nr:hypothetical protein [Joostella atrarenae]MCF8714506.1 hypothetical protein [Joostella atrarenae]